ncbi:hypothetical protein D3C72_1031380 [compost metagenome]
MGDAAQASVAGVEMLFAVDGHGPVLGQGRADAVGPLYRLGPDGAGPQPPAVEGLVVRDRPAPLNRHPLGIGQQNAAPDPADRQEQPVQHAFGRASQRLHGLTRLMKLLLSDGFDPAMLDGIEAVKGDRAPPRSSKSRARARSLVQRLPDQTAVITAPPISHRSVPKGSFSST